MFIDLAVLQFHFSSILIFHVPGAALVDFVKCIILNYKSNRKALVYFMA